MPVLSMNSQYLQSLFESSGTPYVDFTYQNQLDVLQAGHTVGSLTLLQLSSQMIRVSQKFDAVFPLTGQMTFELRVSGAGIAPVSSLAALNQAINNGLATGALNKVEILTGGTAILSMTLDATGYHLTSGAQTLDLQGTLPLNFTDLFDLSGLFNQAANIDLLTRIERNHLFTDLASYGVTELTMHDGAREIFTLHVDATHASISISGIKFELAGTFPVNFGADLSLLWEAARQMGRTGQIDVTTLTGLSVTGLTITDAAGHVLGTMDAPLEATPFSYTLDGRGYDQVQFGSEYMDVFNAKGSVDRVVLLGFDNNDKLIGGGKADFLDGGLGNDRLVGGNGADWIDGGRGRDLLTGGKGADVFHFDLGDGTDEITDFQARVDVIQILDANRKSDLTFTQVGDDVMIDFRNIHILVDHTTVAKMDQVINFDF